MAGNEEPTDKNPVDLSLLSSLAAQMVVVGSTFSSLSLPVEAAGGLLQILGADLSTAFQQSSAAASSLSGNTLGSESFDDASSDPKGEESDGTDPSTQGAEQVKSKWDEVREHVQKLNKQNMDDDISQWLGIVANATSGSKKLQAIHKAASILQIVRNTSTGIMSALAGPPKFPLNFAIAATVAARGAAQLGKVRGQAHDGIKSIPSTGTYLLERGERVVDSRLNTDLSGFLNAQNGAARTNNSVTSDNRSSSVTNAPVINLSIGSDADENAVSSNRGAAETMIREIFADYAMDAPFG